MPMPGPVEWGRCTIGPRVEERHGLRAEDSSQISLPGLDGSAEPFTVAVRRSGLQSHPSGLRCMVGRVSDGRVTLSRRRMMAQRGCTAVPWTA